MSQDTSNVLGGKWTVMIKKDRSQVATAHPSPPLSLPLASVFWLSQTLKILLPLGRERRTLTALTLVHDEKD